MFASVLIANRGEIACRVIRTARRMGLRTVAVFSRADRDAWHAGMADEAVEIGGARPEDSYLRGGAILRAAREAGADCIHPGYGFLAENAGFAETCAGEGVVFVGPPPDAIRKMGRKDEARAIAREAGVPVLPGYEGDFGDAEALLAAIGEIGYPVMVKAVAGGGGAGMRRVENAAGLPGALEAARREAAGAFGDARLMVEKCLDAPRHVEMQIFADAHGNCVHLFERDCSLQRRRQKIVEEAPAPGMTQGLRARMAEAAINAARAVGYSGAGTVEFLVEGNALAGDSPFHFLEMNTRLQVEHPVTEAVTGLDLVEWQFRVAQGEPLGFSQADVALEGHAAEARVCCEDPDNGFLPSSGRLHLVRWPRGKGVRVDAGARTGDAVSPHYDSMLAKIVCHAPDREQALAGLRAALAKTAIAGPKTNLRFLHDLLGQEDFAAGRPDTGLAERFAQARRPRPIDTAAVKAGIEALLRARMDRIGGQGASNEAHSPWNARDGFALGEPRPAPMRVSVDGESMRAEVAFAGDGMTVTLPDFPESGGARENTETVAAGDRVFVLNGPDRVEIAFAAADAASQAAGAADGAIRAPMHGRIAALAAAAGERVEEGAPVAMLEAMKMEHRLTAPCAGVVAEIAVAEGQQVSAGDLIAVIEPEEGA